MSDEDGERNFQANLPAFPEGFRPVPDRSEKTDAEMDETIRQIVHRSKRIRCKDCGKTWADYPSKLCPGCEAYREHLT